VGRLSAAAAATIFGSERARMRERFIEELRPGKIVPDYPREIVGRQQPPSSALNRPRGTAGRNG